tara:strand:+ start:2099 stop:4264 length:2166 start_codon:yes stop_codon:yes gene_type:complete
MVKYFFFLFLIINYVCFADEKIEINADQFTYDKDNTRIYATGNVEIIDKEFKLYAEKVFVNNSSKVLSARENIKIFNSDGSVLKAQKIVADHDLKNALIENNYIYIPTETKEGKNYLRLAAKKVERRDKDWEKLEYGTFTACELCFNEKTKKYDPPLIQLKAKKIIHDKKKLDVKYYDAFLDIKGKSVLYLPYFSHPSPLVKRKAGFLAPSFLQSHYFGFAIDTPYYYPIAEDHDITITPKFSQKKNPALFIEHRKNFRNGEMINQFSGTVENQTVTTKKKDKKRGHINSKGIFYLNSKNYASYKIQRATDRNYQNTYKYRYYDILESNLKLESIRANNSYSLQSFIFQDNRREFNRKHTPKVLPRLYINLNSQNVINSLNFNSNIEMVNLNRTEGNETKKFFITQNLLYPTILKDGTFLKFGAHLNAGLYKIKKYDNPVKGSFDHNKFKHNLFPQFSLEISKPYQRVGKYSTSVFTPKILAVKSNRNAFNRNIPDDSDINNFDLDFVDLFKVNRVHGTDRLDSLSRIDYGFSFLNKANQDASNVKSFQVGQSYQIDNNKYLNKNSGINRKFSDIAGNFDFAPIPEVSLKSYFTIDKENFSLKTAYSSLLLRQKNSILSVSNNHYAPVVDENGKSLIDGKNQFSFRYDQKFDDFWNFTAYTTFDKKNKLKLFNYGTKIKYEDECFGVSLAWTRQFTHNPEDPTSNNFVFLFSLKEIMDNDL